MALMAQAIDTYTIEYVCTSRGESCTSYLLFRVETDSTQRQYLSENSEDKHCSSVNSCNIMYIGNKIHDRPVTY